MMRSRRFTLRIMCNREPCCFFPRNASLNTVMRCKTFPSCSCFIVMFPTCEGHSYWFASLLLISCSGSFDKNSSNKSQMFPVANISAISPREDASWVYNLFVELSFIHFHAPQILFQILHVVWFELLLVSSLLIKRSNSNGNYVFQDAKEHLAALADKLGSSLTEIDVCIKTLLSP